METVLCITCNKTIRKDSLKRHLLTKKHNKNLNKVVKRLEIGEAEIGEPRLRLEIGEAEIDEVFKLSKMIKDMTTEEKKDYYKDYYKDKKEQLLLYQVKYNTENKEQIKIYKQRNYQQNKSNLNQVISCITCNCNITLQNIKQHQVTAKHIRNLKIINNLE